MLDLCLRGRLTPGGWTALLAVTWTWTAAPAAAVDTSDPLKLLGQILAMAVRHKASDIHLRTRNHPILRVDGILRAVREIPPLPADFMERLARTMMSARLQAEFEKAHQADLSIGFKDIGRVRCNAFYQRGSIAMVLREAGRVV